MAPCFCFMAVNHSSHTYNKHLNMSIENEFLWHILLQIHWNKYLSYDIFNKLLFDCFYLLYENEMARQLAKPPQLLDNRAGEPLWSCAVLCWIVAGLGSIRQSYIHACMHACMHTYRHTCIHACMHAYIHIYIYTIYKICSWQMMATNISLMETYKNNGFNAKHQRDWGFHQQQ